MMELGVLWYQDLDEDGYGSDEVVSSNLLVLQRDTSPEAETVTMPQKGFQKRRKSVMR